MIIDPAAPTADDIAWKKYQDVLQRAEANRRKIVAAAGIEYDLACGIAQSNYEIERADAYKNYKKSKV